jgi:hypothetical protein
MLKSSKKLARDAFLRGPILKTMLCIKTTVFLLRSFTVRNHCISPFLLPIAVSEIFLASGK